MCTIIITFQLHGPDATKFPDLVHRFSAGLNPAPGLAHQIRLLDRDTDTYGGVYAFENRQAVDDYLRSEAVATLRSHPNVRNLSYQTFGGIETLAKIELGRPVVVSSWTEDPRKGAQPVPTRHVPSTRRFAWRSHETGPVPVP